MSKKLLVWKWSEDYNSPEKRIRRRLKIAQITSDYVRKGTHPAIGDADFEPYLKNILEVFGPGPADMPFKIEKCNECLVFNFSENTHEEVVPAIRNISQVYGLNSAEFK